MTDEQDWRGALRRVMFDASIRSLCCVEAGRGASRFTRQDHSHGDAPALICRVAAEVKPLPASSAMVASRRVHLKRTPAQVRIEHLRTIVTNEN
jgi:hypothetical protein